MMKILDLLQKSTSSRKQFCSIAKRWQAKLAVRDLLEKDPGQLTFLIKPLAWRKVTPGMTRPFTFAVSLLYILFTSLFLFNSCAQAAPKKSGNKNVGTVYQVPQLQAGLIKLIENYFADLKTFKADFSQKNPDGSVSKGEFYLSRPDKFRLHYKQPKEHI